MALRIPEVVLGLLGSAAFGLTSSRCNQKATTKDLASLGNCPAQVLHKNQPGLSEGNKEKCPGAGAKN